MGFASLDPSYGHLQQPYAPSRKYIMRALLLLIFIAVFPACAAAQVTALTHVTLIDGSGALPRSDVTVVMENGRIGDIVPADRFAPRAGAEIIDATGRF